jgi:hypothetical protein
LENWVSGISQQDAANNGVEKSIRESILLYLNRSSVAINNLTLLQTSSWVHGHRVTLSLRRRGIIAFMQQSCLSGQFRDVARKLSARVWCGYKRCVCSWSGKGVRERVHEWCRVIRYVIIRVCCRVIPTKRMVGSSYTSHSAHIKDT